MHRSLLTTSWTDVFKLLADNHLKPVLVPAQFVERTDHVVGLVKSQHRDCGRHHQALIGNSPRAKRQEASTSPATASTSLAFRGA